MSDLDTHAKAGLKAIEEKRYDDAIAAFEKALEIDGSRPDMNSALGMAYMHRGDTGNAIEPLKRAVDLSEVFTDPQHDAMRLHFHTGLATAYQLTDDTGGAKRVLESAIEKWPNQLEPRIQLGSLFLASCAPEEGLDVYRAAMDLMDEDNTKAAEALVGAVEGFLQSEEPASVFLEAHRDSYVGYFDECAQAQEEAGWIAEAARMAKGPDGEARPILAQGVRPYAMTRIDLVDPESGEMQLVYTENEPCIVAVEGLEPLAQVGVLLPWKGHPFDVWVSTRCPWHWLHMMFQFEEPDTDEALIGAIDELIADWYLDGYNGEFGDKDKGRFHYVTDPERMGTRTVYYAFDLGRASYDSINALMRKLIVLHDRRRIQRVLFGFGRLPE
jgi:tetratricopeptide (TPR) repeat protein